MKIGDTVRLNSGGPLLTVAGIDGDKVTCTWFSANQKFESVILTAALLSKYEATVNYSYGGYGYPYGIRGA